MHRQSVCSPRIGARRPATALRSLALALLVIASSVPARAADFLLNAVVTDIDERPLAGIKLVLGRIEVRDIRTMVRAEASGVTDAEGKLSLMLSSSQSTLGAAVVDQPAGRVVAPADDILRLRSGTTNARFVLLTPPDETAPIPGDMVETEGFFGETGTTTYPPVERQSFAVGEGALKLWRAYGTRQGPPVLLIQGYSILSEQVEAYEVYKAFVDLAQALRQRGRDLWIVTFADVSAPVAGQALIVAKALEKILEPARGYDRVDVVGHSLGGLAGRWALAKEEATGGLSAGKVRVFATIDTPHQGLNVHVALQAALWRIEPAVMVSPALQNMLYEWVGATNFSSDDCEFPRDGSIRSTPAAHDAFYRALNALNGDGYPHRSRNVAVGAGGTLPRPEKVGDNVYRLQASLSIGIGSVRLCRQEYKARPLDLLPGAVFPGNLLPERVDSGSVRVDLDTFLDPTMVPTVSAIDWRDGASKFERFFLPTLPTGKLLRHGAPIPGAAEFLLWQLTDVATTVVELPALPAGGWYRVPVTVALRASSPYNDVTASEVSRDGGATWVLYAAPFEIREDGAHRLLARSRVAAGNLEDPAVQATVRIDATPPTLVINAAEPREYPRGDKGTITVTAADALSGIAAGTLTVRLNGQSVNPAEPIALERLEPGAYTVEAAVEDVAGNRATATVSFTIKP